MPTKLNQGSRDANNNARTIQVGNNINNTMNASARELNVSAFIGWNSLRDGEARDIG